MSDTIHIHIERECPVRVITVEPTGARGAAGTSATVAVGTTTTGAAGTNASVTNSGTTSAAVFNFTIPRGDTGATGSTGPAGPNSVTSATTSDGTANLSIADLEVVGGEIYTDGDYSQIYTQGTDAHIFTLGYGAEIFTVGEVATIATQGANATISTAGAGATIGTQGANATIYTTGTNATISTAGSAAHIQTSHASAAVKSTNFAAVESGGASLVDGSMQPCLTWSAGGRNLTIPSGTATTFNTTSYTYGTGAAAAHRTALELGTLATQNANAATLSGTTTFNGTAYTYGTGAATAHKAALELFTLLTVMESDIGTFVANGGTAVGGSDGDSLNLTTATANLRPNVYRFRNWNRNPGNSGAANVVMPVSLASAGNIIHGGAGANGASFRCGIGMANGASAVAADANATTGRGFGWRIAWNNLTSKLEFNLWAHNGTTYVEGTGIDTGLGAVNLDGFFNVIVRLDAAGTVTAHTWFGNNSAASVPSLTPTVTLAGGPTSGAFANQGTPLWLAATHSTVAPLAGQSIIAKILNRKLILG
jgi:hypothetical protein